MNLVCSVRFATDHDKESTLGLPRGNDLTGLYDQPVQGRGPAGAGRTGSRRPSRRYLAAGPGCHARKGVAGLGADEPVAAAHQLVFIAIDAESDKLGERRIEQPEGVGKVQLTETCCRTGSDLVFNGSLKLEVLTTVIAPDPQGSSGHRGQR